MGKKLKSILTVKKYPANLEALFEKFATILEANEIFVAHSMGGNLSANTFLIVEIGPREGVSSKFKVATSDFTVAFEVENGVLNIMYEGSWTIGGLVKPYIIKSVNQAVRDLSVSTPAPTPTGTTGTTPANKFCSSCGKQVGPGTIFCEGCGANLNP